MERTAREMEDFLEDQHGKLKKIPHVLNVFPSTKQVNGQDTGEPCITFYVEEKIKEPLLRAEEIIPKFVGKYKTDVLELKAPDFRLGVTAPSRLPPRIQKRIAGGVKK